MIDSINDSGGQSVQLSTNSDGRRWLVLALTVTAQFMVILDVAVVNVALPAIQHDLRFSQESLQWVITAYAIIFGGTLLLGGRLADLVGRRRLFVAGVAVFTLSSLLSGVAWSAGSLVAFRALQGLGGALLSPAALSIVITTFKEGRERNTALGIWGAASGSGGAAGVLLGGVLTNYVGWSWIFFVNLPVGALVLALTPFLLRESRATLPHRHFDVAGATSVTAGLMLLVYGITRASERGWSDVWTVSSLAAAAILVAAFLAIESRSPAPLLPLRLFRLRLLSAANAVMVLTAAFGFGTFFLLTLYMQEVLHYSAIQTGVAFVGITLTIAVFANVAQALVTRLGVRVVLAGGMTLAAAASILYANMPVHGTYFENVLPGMVVGGIGLVCGFVTATIASVSGVSPADAGIASGLINTSRQVGGAIGLAAVTTIATTVTRHSDAVGSSAALDDGFRVAFYTLAILALAGALIAALFIQSPTRPDAVEVVDEPIVLEEAA
jgi:EmrB/QacA subfamily drug resistance transporter